jgi:hypothetical protein
MSQQAQLAELPLIVGITPADALPMKNIPASIIAMNASRLRLGTNIFKAAGLIEMIAAVRWFHAG